MISRKKARGIAVLLAAGALAAGTLLGLPANAADGADGRIPFPKPASHRGRWIEYHGRAVGAAGNTPGSPGEACLTCHVRTDCIGCHSTTMPRDHTNYWRTRGHGLMAAGNRERCETCHRQDYCIRCHSETAPRSHTAGWINRHCTICHFGPGGLPGDNCSVCHKRPPH